MNQKELFDTNKLTDRPDLRVCIYYDKKLSIWLFRGWVCGKCNKRLTSKGNAVKHKCSKGHFRERYEDDDIEQWNIKTVSGKPFKKIIV